MYLDWHTKNIKGKKHAEGWIVEVKVSLLSRTRSSIKHFIYSRQLDCLIHRRILMRNHLAYRKKQFSRRRFFCIKNVWPFWHLSCLTVKEIHFLASVRSVSRVRNVTSTRRTATTSRKYFVSCNIGCRCALLVRAKNTVGTNALVVK